MAEFTPINSQEELDKVIGARLQRERDTVTEQFKGFMSPDDVASKYEGYLSPEDVSKKYEGYLSPEEVGAKTSELESKVKKYESQSVKQRIAHEVGLSYDAVGFLNGETEEEIKKSAESLKGIIGKTVAPLATPETTKTKDEERQEALRKTLRGLKGEK